METLHKILNGAISLFSRYGIKSVTMDDVARELGISKKTLYQHVNDKADLVKKALEYFLEFQQKDCLRIADESLNPIDYLLKIGEYIHTSMRSQNPAVIFEMKKYYPESWKVFYNYRSEFLYTCILDNLKKGIELGYFRQDMNPEIITKLYIGMVDTMLDVEVFPPTRYHFTDIHHEIIQYHIRGIATPAGMAYLTNQLQTTNQN